MLGTLNPQGGPVVALGVAGHHVAQVVAVDLALTRGEHVKNLLHVLDHLGVGSGRLAQLDLGRQLVHVVGVVDPFHLGGGNSDALGDPERQPLVQRLKLVEPAQVEALDLTEPLEVDLNRAVGLLHAGHPALVSDALVADGGEVVQLDGLVGVNQPGEHLGLPDRPELLLDVDEFSQLAFDVGVRPIRASLVDLGDLRLEVFDQLHFPFALCHNAIPP